MHQLVNEHLFGSNNAILAADIPNLAGANSAKAVNSALKVHKTNAKTAAGNVQQDGVAKRRTEILKLKKSIHQAFSQTFKKEQMNHLLDFRQSINGFVSIKSERMFAKLMQECLVSASEKEQALLGPNYNPFIFHEDHHSKEFIFTLRENYEQYFPSIVDFEHVKDVAVLSNYFLIKSHDARHLKSGSLVQHKNTTSHSLAERSLNPPILLQSALLGDGVRGIKLDVSGKEMPFSIEDELALPNNSTSLHDQKWLLQVSYKELPAGTPVTMIRKSNTDLGVVLFCKTDDAARSKMMKANANAYFKIPASPPTSEVPSPSSDP